MNNTLAQRNVAHKKTHKPEKRSYKKLIIGSILFLALLTLFFLLMNRPYFFLKSVEVQGLKTIGEQDIHSYVDSYTNQKTWWFIPRKNIFFVKPEKLERSLQHQFPRIAEIDVSIENADTLRIVVTERDARLLWCVNKPYESVFDEECYFTDQSGLFYTRAPYFSDRVFLKVFIAPEIAELSVGSSLYTEEQVIEFLHFIERLETEHNIVVQRVVIDSYDDVHLLIGRLENETFDQYPTILFNRAQSYEEVYRNINLTLDHESFKKDFSNIPYRFERIDVRFDGRLIYKFRTL